jgi:hypothetical protein
VLPLPVTATVCGYTMRDPQTGNMLRAVVVERDVARKAFETEVRQTGAATSLLQQSRSGGNTYKTRVWPLPPQTTTTVEIQVLEKCCVKPFQNE